MNLGFDVVCVGFWVLVVGGFWVLVIWCVVFSILLWFCFGECWCGIGLLCWVLRCFGGWVCFGRFVVRARVWVGFDGLCSSLYGGFGGCCCLWLYMWSFRFSCSFRLLWVVWYRFVVPGFYAALMCVLVWVFDVVFV